ncbi:hypothetical protein Hokovirus_1_323 [Hokovirus HKV1]|uniref:Uncharacterized protein n=1 Tax=Hokovirus HKV1 TaxID=1977638 RepID=A0A1V0SFM4_9VIRU|nr:hypothetical protein Hokovirus_1_323 [Hokovirus HKV1]
MKLNILYLNYHNDLFIDLDNNEYDFIKIPNIYDLIIVNTKYNKLYDTDNYYISVIDDEMSNNLKKKLYFNINYYYIDTICDHEFYKNIRFNYNIAKHYTEFEMYGDLVYLDYYNTPKNDIMLKYDFDNDYDKLKYFIENCVKDNIDNIDDFVNDCIKDLDDDFVKKFAKDFSYSDEDLIKYCNIYKSETDTIFIKPSVNGISSEDMEYFMTMLPCIVISNSELLKKATCFDASRYYDGIKFPCSIKELECFRFSHRNSLCPTTYVFQDSVIVIHLFNIGGNYVKHAIKKSD